MKCNNCDVSYLRQLLREYSSALFIIIVVGCLYSSGFGLCVRSMPVVRSIVVVVVVVVRRELTHDTFSSKSSVSSVEWLVYMNARVASERVYSRVLNQCQDFPFFVFFSRLTNLAHYVGPYVIPVSIHKKNVLITNIYFVKLQKFMLNL